MGIDHNGLRFLLTAWKSGVSFRQTATIGRQELHASDVVLAAALKEVGLPGTIEFARGLRAEGDGYAEPLLRLLGAGQVTSFDASSYEGATSTHDFNCPIDRALEGEFTVVIDAGSLEHIYNFPVAIGNCMRLISEGGHFLSITPANNQMGHGFYQFSPDLYYRIFCAGNGFQMERCFAFEDVPGAVWYEVADPATVKGRVGTTNALSLSLMIRAKRIAPAAGIRVTPQQSDYSALWASGAPGFRARFRSDRMERFKLAVAPAIRLFRRSQAIARALRPFHRSRYFKRWIR
jgi:hypothetical protein